jgi:glycosyltransferase involved in cell wall biosynthesis
MKKNKLIVIGGSIVESDGTFYFARSQILEYLSEFNAFYSEVKWIVRLGKSKDYKTRINKSPLLDIINKNQETILSIKGIRNQLLSYWRFFKNLDKRTDTIVSSYSTTSIPYILMASLFGRKAVYYLGNDPALQVALRKESLYGKFAARANQWFLPLALKRADGVLVRGKSTVAQCKKWNTNIILSNPLISYNHFKELHNRKRAPNDNKQFNILYVGKLDENKGVQCLLEAIRILVHERSTLTTSIFLNIAGSGPMEKKLNELVDDLNIKKLVFFHGFIDDAEKLSDFFCSSHLFVVPTLRHEGFPRVIDEAMACGLPVICSRLGGMKDSLDEKEVLFFKPGDSKGLADAIETIISQELIRKQLIIASRKRFATLFQQTAAEQHYNFLTNI